MARAILSAPKIASRLRETPSCSERIVSWVRPKSSHFRKVASRLHETTTFRIEILRREPALPEILAYAPLGWPPRPLPSGPRPARCRARPAAPRPPPGRPPAAPGAPPAASPGAPRPPARPASAIYKQTPDQPHQRPLCYTTVCELFKSKSYAEYVTAYQICDT